MFLRRVSSQQPVELVTQALQLAKVAVVALAKSPLDHYHVIVRVSFYRLYLTVLHRVTSTVMAAGHGA